jgi:hypothetical protein
VRAAGAFEHLDRIYSSRTWRWTRALRVLARPFVER